MFMAALYLYAISAGMAAAGIVASAYSLATNRPPSLAPWTGPIPVRLCWAVYAVIAGPFILVRNSLRGLRHEGRPIEFVALGGAVAALWSMMSGIFLIQLALAMS